jgi:hypothetical protein
MTLRSIHTASVTFAVAAALACAPAVVLAQSGSMSGQPGSMSGQSGSMSGQQPTTPNSNPSAGDMSQPNPAGAHQWTDDQILTATVHQAWQLAGKDETNFFEIVRQLAEISARNRNLTLPDDPAAGKRAGEYIKTQAKADHDQLLYAIVDKAVQMTATKNATGTTASSPATH